ncbi:MAG: pyruvate kinase [Lachnospiraceae bacterium]|nr:pyruvate kinase [Lachnospiraceae bacterium]
MKNYTRKTKIICTLGPSTDSEEKMRALIEAGMNVGRFNFSHGLHEEQEARLALLEKVRDELDAPVSALLDTKGPEIRLDTFEKGSVVLKEGQEFTLTTKDVTGNENTVGISYKDLPSDVEKGSHILIDDGLIDMEVLEVSKTDIKCRVVNGGKISDRKGVNVPNVDLTMPFLSPKDKKDLIFGVQHGFDFIAASFVRTADDIKEMRAFLKEYGGDDIQIIAKIESYQGIKNIDAIISEADGVMVARGDMGVEIPLEEVPPIQKMIIKKGYKAGKFVITATQMLDSMMKNPRPTRAEATDVANAVYDGTSAVMLSGETAAGKYPVEACATMAKICERTEKDINYVSRLKEREIRKNPSVTDAVSHSACTMASDLNASAIMTVTMSGRTAHMVSKYRPASPIIAGCIKKKVWRQMGLCWGVTPILIEEKTDAEELFSYAVDVAEKAKLLEEGDTVIITAGMPLGISGTTNMLKTIYV